MAAAVVGGAYSDFETAAEAMRRMISSIFLEDPLLKYWSSNLISVGRASGPDRISDNLSIIGSKDAITSSGYASPLMIITLELGS